MKWVKVLIDVIAAGAAAYGRHCNSYCKRSFRGDVFKLIRAKVGINNGIGLFKVLIVVLIKFLQIVPICV